jgi:hypothetical protein
MTKPALRLTLIDNDEACTEAECSEENDEVRVSEEVRSWFRGEGLYLLQESRWVYIQLKVLYAHAYQGLRMSKGDSEVEKMSK